MVGPGEVDEDLQPETTEECSKYGDVANCLVYEVKPYCMYIEFVCHRAHSTHVGQETWSVLHTLYCSFITTQIPHGVDESEAVRIFVQFTRLESAIKGTGR